jgi:hypothetical protein
MVAYMSYRHGRHDLQLPSPDEGWAPVVDGEPDAADDEPVDPEDELREPEPEAGPGSAAAREAEPESTSMRVPGELVEGATARLRAVLEAYPEVPGDLA